MDLSNIISNDNPFIKSKFSQNDWILAEIDMKFVWIDKLNNIFKN